MEGYWTNQTFTPVERPAQFKDQAVFTAEEAAAWAKRGIDNIVDQPRGAEVTRDSEIHYDDAIWMLEGYPKGAMLRTSIITAPADGLSERCIYWGHEGPPLLPTGYNSNLQIVQAAQQFVVIPEMMPVARVVPLDGRPKLGSAVRGYRGDSRGRWDGDTMVVETTNYSEKNPWRGASPGLKVTERFTLINPKAIRYQFTVEDPATWSRPWSGEYAMTRIDGPIFEYACHEGNYGLPSILKGARLAEEAAKQSGGR
jgi:hypothetical protein